MEKPVGLPERKRLVELRSRLQEQAGTLAGVLDKSTPLETGQSWLKAIAQDMEERERRQQELAKVACSQAHSIENRADMEEPVPDDEEWIWEQSNGVEYK